MDASDASSEDSPQSTPHYALQFDGYGDEVEFPTNIGAYGAEFAFEAWVRPTSSTPGSSEGEGGTVFVHRGECADFWLEWSGTVSRHPDRFRFFVYPVAGCDDWVAAESEITSTVGEWHHVAGVFDDGVVRLFVDGALTATATQSLPIAWDTRLYGHWAGRDGHDSRPNRSAFIGEIDEIRVSKIPRYTTDFTPPHHFEADDSTVALWLFDEGSGSIAEDTAGTFDGSVEGAVWVASER